MNIFDLFAPNNYPIYITLPACILLLIAMIVISYRRLSPIISALFFVASFVFMHLNLATYSLTYSLMNQFLGWFRLENLPAILGAMIRIGGWLVLCIPPLLVWLAPLVMLDEQFVEPLNESDRKKFGKTLIIFCIGLIVNFFFVLAIFS